MNAEFVEAVAKANELRTGDTAAQQVITEALIATLLQAFPPLAEQMENHLNILAGMQRQAMTEDGELAKCAFEKRIQHTHGLLNALQQGR